MCLEIKAQSLFIYYKVLRSTTAIFQGCCKLCCWRSEQPFVEIKILPFRQTSTFLKTWSVSSSVAVLTSSSISCQRAHYITCHDSTVRPADKRVSALDVEWNYLVLLRWIYVVGIFVKNEFRVFIGMCLSRSCYLNKKHHCIYQICLLNVTGILS